MFHGVLLLLQGELWSVTAMSLCLQTYARKDRVLMLPEDIEKALEAVIVWF